MRLSNEERLIGGVKVIRRGQQIAHLLFTDDYVIFGEATLRGKNN